MKVIDSLRQRYHAWLARQLLEQLVHDGLYDTDVNIWSWMLEVIDSKEFEDLSVNTRATTYYESCCTDIDAMLVEFIEATKTIIAQDAVERRPPQEFLSVRMEDFLVTYQNRPLPLPLIQEQFVKVCKTFIEALQHPKNKRSAYYLRQYDWLIQEGQRWAEYWGFNLTN